MIVAIRTMKRTFLNGKRNLAKPYATTMPDVTAPIVLRTAIAAVLNSSRGKFSCDQAVVKLATPGANVQDWVSVRQWPCQTIGVAAGSFGSTKVLCSRPFVTSIRVSVVPLIGTS